MALTNSTPLGSKMALAALLACVAMASSAAPADSKKEDPCEWESSNLATVKQNLELFRKADSISDAEVREWSRLLVFKRNKEDEQRCPGNAADTNDVALAALTSRKKDVGPYLKRACSYGIRDPQSIERPVTDVSLLARDKTIRDGATRALERLGMPTNSCGKYEAADPFDGLSDAQPR